MKAYVPIRPPSKEAVFLSAAEQNYRSAAYLCRYNPTDLETVEKPRNRSPLRRFLGREYYILRRRLRWYAGGINYVKRPVGVSREKSAPYTLITHKSMLLRPLKDVAMYLQYNKITNLSLAIERLNGTVIRPGERMSLWKLVGRPTGRKGYLDGLVLHNGRIDKGIGGGLCQLGNLIYWMALHTELDITERWRHSYDVFPDVNRTIPFACGATLSYNYVDLELANNTRQSFFIHLWLDHEYLHGEIKSDIEPLYDYHVHETDHCIRQQWWGGYTRHNRIWKKRISRINGSEEEFLVSENHAIMMYNPLLPAGQEKP